jgi:hypothetical protein
MDLALLKQKVFSRGPLVDIQDLFTNLTGDDWENVGRGGGREEPHVEFEFVDDIGVGGKRWASIVLQMTGFLNVAGGTSQVIDSSKSIYPYFYTIFFLLPSPRLI